MPMIQENSTKAHWLIIPSITLTLIIAALALKTEAIAIEQTNEAQATQALAEKVGCLECHKEKKIGPPYHDVAAKYKDNARAREALFQKVKKGGKGNWSKLTGGTPMPSFARRLSDAEIRRLVNWILSQ